MTVTTFLHSHSVFLLLHSCYWFNFSPPFLHSQLLIPWIYYLLSLLRQNKEKYKKTNHTTLCDLCVILQKVKQQKIHIKFLCVFRVCDVRGVLNGNVNVNWDMIRTFCAINLCHFNYKHKPKQNWPNMEVQSELLLEVQI